MLQFYYRFIAPHRSILELRRIDTVMHLINAQFTQHVGDCWEHLCRQYISGNEIDGIVYNIASRWWGKIFPEGNKEGTMIELDVVQNHSTRNIYSLENVNGRTKKMLND